MAEDDEDELPDAVHAQVTAFSEEGDGAMDEGRYDAAVAAYARGLAVLPEPKGRWEAALWLHAATGDALRAKGDVRAALDQFGAAYRAADGYTNPFVLFNLGACYLDTGDEAQAEDFLLRAYMLAGEDLFEDEDETYLAFLRRRKLVD